MSRSTTDIVFDMENMYEKMKLHWEGLNDSGEDQDYHSRMLKICEKAMETLEKEMDSLASGQIRMTDISESLTRMYNEPGAMMDNDNDDE